MDPFSRRAHDVCSFFNISLHLYSSPCICFLTDGSQLFVIYNINLKLETISACIEAGAACFKSYRSYRKNFSLIRQKWYPKLFFWFFTLKKTTTSFSSQVILTGGNQSTVTGKIMLVFISPGILLPESVT